MLASLPIDIQAGIVVSQHIPAAFSGPFAKRVDSITALSVCEAADGQQILPGHVYIAPGDRHLLVERDGARYVCRLNDGPPVNRHRPSVDVMIRSLAQNAGPNAIGLMLTGMGDDGAAGMGELKQIGAPILVQDEKTSVVWGMPGEVVKRGFADEILPLGRIAGNVSWSWSARPDWHRYVIFDGSTQDHLACRFIGALRHALPTLNDDRAAFGRRHLG